MFGTVLHLGGTHMQLKRDKFSQFWVHRPNESNYTSLLAICCAGQDDHEYGVQVTQAGSQML